MRPLVVALFAALSPAGTLLAQQDTVARLTPFTEASLKQNVYVMILDVGKNDLLFLSENLGLPTPLFTRT